jgi:hypothetical protein
MEWAVIDRAGTERAWGEDWTYVVTQTETGVQLTRFGAERGVLLTAVAEVMRNLIVFPLGRGPGRPGGEPELAALVESAKTWAERFETGGGLHWPTGGVSPDRIDGRTGPTLRDMTRRAPARAFLGEKPCSDPSCECHDG